MLETKLFLAIEKELDQIVQLAEKCITETNAASTNMEEAQFRNFQNLAAATDSVLVLENFIAYQIGRKKVDASVGRRILQDMESLDQKAREICRQQPEEILRRLRMELVRLYLGFLVRKFIAERKS